MRVFSRSDEEAPSSTTLPKHCHCYNVCFHRITSCSLYNSDIYQWTPWVEVSNFKISKAQLRSLPSCFLLLLSSKNSFLVFHFILPKCQNILFTICLDIFCSSDLFESKFVCCEDCELFQLIVESDTGFYCYAQHTVERPGRGGVSGAPAGKIFGIFVA